MESRVHLSPANCTCRSIYPLVTDFSLKGFDPQVKWKLSCAAVSMNTEGYFALAKNQVKISREKVRHIRFTWECRSSLSFLLFSLALFLFQMKPLTETILTERSSFVDLLLCRRPSKTPLCSAVLQSSARLHRGCRVPAILRDFLNGFCFSLSRTTIVPQTSWITFVAAQFPIVWTVVTSAHIAAPDILGSGLPSLIYPNMISPVIDIEYTFYPRPKVVFETFPKLFINCIVNKGIRCAVRVDTDLAQSYYTIRVFCFACGIKRR